MELRKNPAIDLDRKRGMFFSIGLLTSISLVLMAFEWNVRMHAISIPPVEPEDEWDVYMEPVATVIEPPKKPTPKPTVRKKIQQPVFIETKKEIEKVTEALIQPKEDDFESMIMEEDLPPEEPEVYVGIVEQMPEPMGGMDRFYRDISKRLKYPKTARRMHIEGRVFVQFIVDRDGSLTNVEVIKGIGGGCDEEAIRVISSLPRWNPGKQRGKPVKVRMIVPLVFRLS